MTSLVEDSKGKHKNDRSGCSSELAVRHLSSQKGIFAVIPFTNKSV